MWVVALEIGISNIFVCDLLYLEVLLGFVDSEDADEGDKDSDHDDHTNHHYLGVAAAILLLPLLSPLALNLHGLLRTALVHEFFELGQTLRVTLILHSQFKYRNSIK